MPAPMRAMAIIHLMACARAGLSTVWMLTGVSEIQCLRKRFICGEKQRKINPLGALVSHFIDR